MKKKRDLREDIIKALEGKIKRCKICGKKFEFDEEEDCENRWHIGEEWTLEKK